MMDTILCCAWLDSSTISIMKNYNTTSFVRGEKGA